MPIQLENIRNESHWLFRHGGLQRGRGRTKEPSSQSNDQLRKFLWKKGNKTEYLENNVYTTWRMMKAAGMFASDSAFEFSCLENQMATKMSRNRVRLFCVHFVFSLFSNILEPKWFRVVCFFLLASRGHSEVEEFADSCKENCWSWTDRNTDCKATEVYALYNNYIVCLLVWINSVCENITPLP